MLPIDDPAHRLTLGEGAPRCSTVRGSPASSACAALLAEVRRRRTPRGRSRTGRRRRPSPAALRFGFRAISVVSSGNAGSSIAAYAARAGLRSLIFAYERASAPKLLHMAATTPTSSSTRASTTTSSRSGIGSSKSSCSSTAAPRATRTSTRARRRSPTRSRSRAAGQPPDVVVAPVAVGETFIATARGFREMARGRLDRRRAAAWSPRRRRGANAVARAFRDGARDHPAEDRLHRGRGPRGGDPGKKGRVGAPAASRRQGAGRRRRRRRDPRDAATARPGGGRLGGPDRRRDPGGARPAPRRRSSSTPPSASASIITETGLKTEARAAEPRAASPSTSTAQTPCPRAPRARCRCRAASISGRRPPWRATCSAACSSHGAAARSRRAASWRPKRTSVPRTQPPTPHSDPAAARSSMARAASPTCISTTESTAA